MNLQTWAPTRLNAIGSFEVVSLWIDVGIVEEWVVAQAHRALGHSQVGCGELSSCCWIRRGLGVLLGIVGFGVQRLLAIVGVLVAVVVPLLTLVVLVKGF